MSRGEKFDEEASYGFRLLVVTAFYHPVIGFRKIARSFLENWVGGLDSPADVKQLNDLLRSASGTALEPFIFTDDDIECALFLARAAFSTECDVSRLRLVSRDNLGDKGGLVLTKANKAYFIERFAHGKNRAPLSTGWVFAPEHLSHLKNLFSEMRPATLSPSPKGFEIKVSNVKNADKFLDKGGRFFGTKTTLKSIGLSITESNSCLKLEPSEPEAVIRLMAHMAAGDVIEIGGSVVSQWHNGERINAKLPRILIKLQLPDEKSINLQTLRSVSDDDLQGLQCQGFNSDIHIGTIEKKTVAEWLPVADSWMDGIFKELYPNA
jgi:hypothetical protein